MNALHEIRCPSCSNLVWPERRKLPGNPDEKGRIGNPTIAFGNFCPVVGCNARLKDDLSAYNADSSEFLHPDEGTDEPEERIAPKPRKVVPIRKNDSEDLFVRIPREYEEAVREERELTEKLQTAIERRERLARLMDAIGAPKEPVAAE